MSKKTILLLIITIFAITGCRNAEPIEDNAGNIMYSRETVKKAQDAIRKGGEGYEFAEKTGISKNSLDKVVSEISEAVDIDSISEFQNTASVNNAVSSLDVRFATVRGKDGKTYTACFDGKRGVLFGLADEQGNIVAGADPGTVINEGELPLGSKLPQE